jgi:cysteine desulfurase
MQVYLDNAATTRLDPRVLAKMKPYFSDKYANASSIHLPGQSVYLDLVSAKEKIAKILGGEARNIVFTSGATESNNFIIKGVARAYKNEKRNKIIVSEIEHPCVREAVNELKNEGFEIIYLKPNTEGIIEPAELEKFIDNKTLLVSVMMVNNEIGTINDVTKLSELTHKHGAFFHTDAVQAVPYLKINIIKMGIDFLSLSAHKFNGPKGIGLAYINRKIKIRPLLSGGGQEEGLRSGTYNIPGIIGLAYALELAYKERMVYLKKVKFLRDYFWKRLNTEISNLKVNGNLKKRTEANLNVMFSSIEGEAILIDLSRQGIAVSTGSACSATDLKSSYVLKAMGLDKNYLNSNIRFSLGKYNTKKEIDYTLSCLKKTVKRLRSFSPIVLK